MNLNVHKLLYHYPNRTKPVLRDISLDLPSGSYVCLAGPNGSGKSTFLKLLCSLVDSSGLTGFIRWDNENVLTIPRREIAKKIAYVPESIFPELAVSVFEFVLQGRFPFTNFWSKPTDQDEKIAYESLKTIGIENISEKSVTEISSGQLQLTTLARALAQNPKALLLDESTANLDLDYQIRFFEILKKLHNDGMTILLASHDLNIATEYCPQIMWMLNGEILALGNTEEMFTTEWLTKIYGANDKLKVSQNPFTKKPKIFLS